MSVRGLLLVLAVRAQKEAPAHAGAPLLAECLADPSRAQAGVSGAGCPPADSPAAAAYLAYVNAPPRAAAPAAADRQLYAWDNTGRSCPMFSDGRVSEPQWNLQNCTNHRKNSCCRQADVTAAFSELGSANLMLDAGVGSVCTQIVTALMCHFCAYDQSDWYDASASASSSSGALASGHKAVTVCKSMCDRVYYHCAGAFYNGVLLSDAFSDGREFCEANNFEVYNDGSYSTGGPCFGVFSDPWDIPWLYSARRRLGDGDAAERAGRTRSRSRRPTRRPRARAST